MLLLTASCQFLFGGMDMCVQGPAPSRSRRVHTARRTNAPSHIYAPTASIQVTDVQIGESGLDLQAYLEEAPTAWELVRVVLLFILFCVLCGCGCRGCVCVLCRCGHRGCVCVNVGGECGG